MSASECIVEDESEAGILTQEEVNDQIRSYIDPLTKQLEDLIRLIQGMSRAKQPNNYPRAATSVKFSEHGYQPDKNT